MRFNKGARLDTSEVSDVRGMRKGTKAAIGGGGAGLIGLLVVLLAGALGGGGGGDILAQLEGLTVGAEAPGAAQADNAELAAVCQTGADAEERQDCRIVATVNSVQDYWAGALPGYQPADTTFFEGAVDTACGPADSSVGPFYCPADQLIYIDLGFYQDLQTRFGAKGGPSPRPT